MISQDLRTLTAPFKRMSGIIWMGFVLAPVGYCVLAWVLTGGGEKQMGRGELPAEAIYIAILLSLASGILFPWVIAPRIAGPARQIESPNSPPVKFEGESARVFERLGERDQDRARHLGAIQSSRIVRWAGAESVAIYGLIAMMMGVASMYVAWAFCAASIALLVMLRPDYERDLEDL